MKKTATIIALWAACSVQAQILYVNNSDDTYQAVDTKNIEEITFNEDEQLIMLRLDNGAISRFSTSKIESISTATDKREELTYSLNPDVAFDTDDINNYNEIVESVITDETNDESGDFVENYETTRVVTVTFSENGVKTNPAKLDQVTFTAEGNHLTINSQRSKVAYLIRGNCSNGSLKIYSLKKFQILANGITLTNPTGPAINIQSGKTVYFTITDGTTNNLCDGTVYDLPAKDNNGVEEDQKGTLFSEGQLIFNGGGTLNVTAKGGHAICSDDYIRIRSGNINILDAAKDGFRTKDKFIIGRTVDMSPSITVNATNNGIDCSEGTFTIEAGRLDIKSGSEAIKVEYEEAIPDPAIIPDAFIKGGYIKIATNGEKSSAIKTTGNYTQSGGTIQAEVVGNGSKIINCDGNVLFSGGKVTAFAKGTVATDTTSAGGIKCNGNLEITGGTIALECNGKGAKGINCNGNVVVSGGNTVLLTNGENYTDIADDKKSRAITARSITIDNGTIVASAYNHAMAADTGITINGGRVNAFSTSSTALGMEATQTGGWLLTKGSE